MCYCSEKHGAEDVNLIRDCLYALHDYSGASGIFSINEYGGANKDIIIKTVKGGEFVRLK